MVTEVERKYDVPEGFSAELVGAGIPAVREVSPLVTRKLTAVYFDTADYRLASAGVTLRRRSGGNDDGWHLKLPAAPLRGGAPDTRLELREPLGRATRTVPARLAALVRAYTRGRPLRPVATLATVRLERELRGDGGKVLATLVEDEVAGTVTGHTPVEVAWRELELELVGGDMALLDALDAQVTGGGATRAGAASKLGRLLDDRVPPRWPGMRPARKGDPAGVAVLAAVRAQVEALVGWDPLVRADEPDAVHQLRVTTRRLRALLKVYGPLLADSELVDMAAAVRAELGWLAGVLGEARDLEVLRADLAERIAALPPELVRGDIAGWVDATLAARRERAHAAVVAALESPRHRELLDTLIALCMAEPATEPATEPAIEPATEPESDQPAPPARRALPAAVDRAWRRAGRAVEAARSAPAAERAAAWHEVRKVAKRVRYATEAAGPVLGRRGREQADRFLRGLRRLQETLGADQDNRLLAGAVIELADLAAAEGRETFTLGVLAAEASAQDTAAVPVKAWRRATRRYPSWR
jgi:CHAD domain-containing protein